MANYFEVVSKYKDAELALPVRATKYAAGYDLAAAEDTIIPPFGELFQNMVDGNDNVEDFMTLEEMASLTKALKTKPTLVPTGMKCHLGTDKYLEISARSSLPLKHWLIVANGVGIIDADYYDSDNEGHIFVQLVNLSPFPIKIQKGEKIAQGIIKTYSTTEDDKVTTRRTGGFGSTTK